MLGWLRIWLLHMLTFAVMSLGFAAEVHAGWLTIKNDTGKQIVVQEVVVVNGQTRRGKQNQMLAGDTIREFLPIATVKQVEIYDAQNPKAPIWSGTLNCKDDSQTFSVALNGGKVTITPVAPKK